MASCIQLAEQPRNRNTFRSRPMRFDMICEANGIEHRLAKPNHLWSREDKNSQGTVSPRDGQVDRTNRTIKAREADRKGSEARFPAERQTLPLRKPRQLASAPLGLHDGLELCPPAHDLEPPEPCEYVCKIWTSEADRFILHPIHLDAGIEHLGLLPAFVLVARK